MALMLLGLVISLTYVNLKDSRGRVDSRNLVEQISEELRLARQKAQVRGVPVAVAFPSLSGTVPHSQSFYVLEGDTQPRITKAFNFGNENSAVLFKGFWTPDAGTNRSGRKAAGTPGERFQLSEWNAPYPDDPVYVFTPSGAVVSNQVAFQGAYHIVAARGVQYTGAMVDGINSFHLDGACQPWTVSLSTAGEVNVREGVTAGSAVALLPTPPAGTPAPAIALPPMGPNSAPSVTVSVYPVPIADSLAPGIDATSRVNSYLLLKATAGDADGDVLFCNWTASQGAFSNTQPTRMQWDPEKQEWFSYWNWQAPIGDPGTGVYQLNCQVDDRRGGTANGQLGVAGQLETLSPQQICFVGYDGPPASTPGKLMVMNIDGTEAYRLTEPPISAGRPRWAPNGKRIAFLSPWGGASDVYTVKRDGSSLSRLVDASAQGWNSIVDLDYNSSGNALFLLVVRGTVKDVVRIDLSSPGSPTTVVSDIPLGGFEKLTVRRSDNNLLTTDGTQLLWVDTLANTSTPVPIPAGYTGGFFEPCFSPAGNMVVWQDAGGNSLYTAPFDTTAGPNLGAPTTVRTSGQAMHTPSFSPDQTQLIYNETISSDVNQIRRCRLDGSQDATLTIPHPTYSEDEGSWSSK